MEVSGSINFISDDNGINNVGFVEYDTAHITEEPLPSGHLCWNQDDGTLNLGLTETGGNVILQVGQELQIYVRNQSGATIENGAVVYASGVAADKILIEKFAADGTVPLNNVLGLTTHNIPNNSTGYVTVQGRVREIDTTAFNVGDTVYAHPTITGSLIDTEPQPPSQSISIGYITEDSISGSISVNLRRNRIASEILYNNSGSNLVSTNVGAAINELDTTKASIDQLTSNIILYPTTTASADIAGYSLLVESTTDPSYNLTAVDVATGGVSGSGQLLSSLATSGSVFTGDPGVVNITTLGNIQKTSINANRNATFYFEVYKRSGSVETLVATSNETDLVTSTSYSKFSATALLNNGIFTQDDRIVLKFYGNNDGGGAPTYNFQFGGSDPVRSLFPVPISVVPIGDATGIETITTDFNGILSGADDTVQKALDTLDDHSHTLQQITDEGNSTTNEIQAGGLDIDAGVLYVNPTDNQVGINTTNTAEALTVEGNISGSGNVNIQGSITASAFTGIFEGALSSSAQIATEISGAFNDVSSSFETRITLNENTGSNHETRLDNLEGKTLVSSSAQIAGDISGSFTSVSQSIASDITDIIDGTTTVTSASYAVTASYALNGGGGGALPSGVVSGSDQVSGSFVNIDGDTMTGTLTFNSGSNSGILRGSDSQRMLIGGGSSWSGTSGAYITIEGLDFGGIGLGGNINFALPSGKTFTVNSQTVWHSGNDGAGSGLDADLLDGFQASQFLRSDTSDIKTSGDLTFNDNILLNLGTGNDFRLYHNGSDNFLGLQNGDLHVRDTANSTNRLTIERTTGNITSTGDYSTTGNIESGKGSGGVALTINDGQGNANVTFNHANGVAEQAGNCGRIIVNTDGTTGARMYFEVKSNSSAGNVNTTEVLSLTETGAEFNDTVTADNFILSSDRRLKSDIEDIDIDKPLNIKWKSFTMKGETRYGVIADETNPQLVKTKEDGYNAVDYHSLYALAFAEKDRQIKSLEERVDRLELILKKLL